MSTNELMIIENKVNAIKDFEEAANELLDKANALKDDIKAMMTENNETEVVTKSHVVRFREILSTKFDKRRFISDMGEDAYLYYTKQVSSMRFNID